MAIVKRGKCSKLSSLQVVKCEFICEKCGNKEEFTSENSKEDKECKLCKSKMIIATKVTNIIDTN